MPNRVQGTAGNREREIESAISLSTKKQRLNDIRSLKPPTSSQADYNNYSTPHERDLNT